MDAISCPGHNIRWGKNHKTTYQKIVYQFIIKLLKPFENYFQTKEKYRNRLGVVPYDFWERYNQFYTKTASFGHAE